MNFVAKNKAEDGKGLPPGHLRLEVAWHASPEQSVPIVDLTGQVDPNGLAILPIAGLPAIPPECCYL